MIGNETVGGTLGVTNTTTLTGNVGIGGASGTENLLVTGSERITGNLDVSGDLNVTGTLTLKSSATTTTSTQIPVFITDPSTTARTLVTRTPAQLRGDIGALSVVDLSVTNGTTSGPVINSSAGTNATLPSASATISGIVTTGAQTIGGTKIFSKVGIGTNNPICMLDIAKIGNSVSQSTLHGRYVFYANNGLLGTVQFSNVVVRSQGDIICDGAIGSYSDGRIKKNIADVSDSSALDKLRLLKPKTYNYIDIITKGTEQVYGFIAQEVSEVISNSTTLTIDKIPNIYQLADVCNNQLILQNPFTLEYDASNQLYNTLCLYDANDLLHTVEIIDISNQTISISGEITGNQMFVYGQEVDNLHVLKKDAIWTISTAALQEVDRQLQEEKIKTYTLQTQYNDLLSRITSLENNPT